MLNVLTAEATECDFKAALETKKPKSWLKSVSAYANGIGGKLIFGIDDDRNIIGLSDVQKDAECISRLIRDRITPYPDFILVPQREQGKDLLIVSVSGGHSTPYYYKADGIMEAYIRIGNESVIAPPYMLNQLILNGMNCTYDVLTSNYYFKDYEFSQVRDRYRIWTQNTMDDKLFDSFRFRDEQGRLTNAGALMADNSPIRHSRLFCTRWNGLDKSGGVVDALDSAEYSGSLIKLLNEGVEFVKRNSRKPWMKTADSRIEMPDYCERSVFEGLVNSLIHRNYLELGSEVHIDMYDDRLTIVSPGGMFDGSRVQDQDILSIASKRRNPLLAEIFGHLGYMERSGSGFRKILEAYQTAYKYRQDLKPRFYSNSSTFWLTLYNLNYEAPEKVALTPEKVALTPEKVALTPGKVALDPEKVALDPEKVALAPEKVALTPEKVALEPEKVALDPEKVALTPEKVALDPEKVALGTEKEDLERYVSGFGLSAPTKQNICSILAHFKHNTAFSRADVIKLCDLAPSSAGKLINRMKELGLLKAVPEQGRGKYLFIRRQQ